MQALSIVGSGSAEIRDAVVAHLDGRVAAVGRTESVDDAPGDADGRFELSEDGDWTASGGDRSFADLLDELAPDYDYAVISGFSKLRLPTVVIGDAEVPGDVLRRVDDAAALDPGDIAAELDELDPYVTLETLVTEAKQSPLAERSGAIATFTGRVRAKDAADDSRTTHLKFEKYDGVAEQRMADIAAALEEREGVFEVLFHHRTGVVVDGEDIVFVVVLAGHRREAFRTVEDGIDRLKDEVPLFKKETTEDEEFWVHDRA
ncbi:putative bifunctional molybdopterin-guanine dinucleotide biosynthesis protein MobB/MoaE [Halolamina pelagica]|uniref:Putative bifunctional molybdopterin-guanine dinucleotide biosynthesis protein MobB/MoaE n=1 Tax=Halolamina pelagica TaxID=699431 RepID=A0A0P7GNG9_9EURY|nr:molybdopterin synthase [Halolamina pelagica]KPN30173.1 putative bifunctional molybdopterin-guanine dinucleotide biosynthesis protein MobB/MoaE [Halolamina pelagica]